jgi:hypothetical protein
MLGATHGVRAKQLYWHDGNIKTVLSSNYRGDQKDKSRACYEPEANRETVLLSMRHKKAT